MITCKELRERARYSLDNKIFGKTWLFALLACVMTSAITSIATSITMPLLGALKNVSEQEQARVRQMVKDIVAKPELRDEIVTFVKENGGLEYSVRRLNEYVDSAVRALDVLPESEEKDFLVQLAHYTGKRDK